MKKIKKIIKNSKNRARKKGAIMIEFIAAVPIFFLIIWGIMNIMMMLLATNQLNEAAYEAGRSVAVEMRGQEGDIVPGKHNLNIDRQIHLVIDSSPVIQLFKATNTPEYAYTKDACDALITKNSKNIICAYNEAYDAVPGKTHERVIVKLRSSYLFIGDWIPGLDNWVTINAKAVVQKELTDRYQYAQ